LKYRLTNSIASLFLVLMFSTQFSCVQEIPKKNYLNLADSVDYVGAETCKSCHYDKHKTFSHTGMGLSFGLANRTKSSATFHKDSVLYDAHSDLYYHPLWKEDSLLVNEYRIANGDTVHKRTESAAYIIGSGQHTNSHISNENGYLHQLPFTYYTQEGRLDLPPGFEGGFNTRFNRKIGLECMSCHNSLPKFVLGSENKFEEVPLGISCERCHGPGEIHVSEKMKGILVDTSKFIDYTIVNPGKLSPDLQFDLCSRCHLQGNTVLEEDKSFFDFKPGMKLDDVMNVFLPRFKDDERFIMASHVDRLKMSQCFIKSNDKLTCITCHNPHLSINATPKVVYKNACYSCHSDLKEHENEQGDDCVSCHMPKSGSTDIPHVTVTDHKIAITQHMSLSESKSVKEFIGLYCVNNSSPSDLTILRAYLQQYEKFEKENYYLDSAFVYLSKIPLEMCTSEWIKFYFFSLDFNGLVNWFERASFESRSNQLNKRSYTNDDAWSWYRVGESYYKTKNYEKASVCFEQASLLAPFHLEIQNKFGMALLKCNRLKEAQKVFEFVRLENPNFEKVYANYGYLYTILGEFDLALIMYEKGIALNPDIVQLWMNLAAYYLHFQNIESAQNSLSQVLRIKPNHKRAQQLLNQIK
jgi:hypothetical protein